jgi:hypothetical protein
LPCYEKSLFLCLLGSYGATLGSGVQVQVSHQGSAPYASVGARVGIDLPLAGQLGLRGYGQIEFPITQTSFSVDTLQVWKTPPIAGSAGLLARVRFP